MVRQTKPSINQRARESSPSFRKAKDSFSNPSKILLCIRGLDKKRHRRSVCRRLIGLFHEKYAKDVTLGLFLQYNICERRIPSGVYVKKCSVFCPKRRLTMQDKTERSTTFSAQINPAKKLFICSCPKKEMTGRTIAKGGRISMQNRLQ